MHISWVHELDVPLEDCPDSSRAPIHWYDERVWLPIAEWARPQAGAIAGRSRGTQIRLHSLEREGICRSTLFSTARPILSEGWSFLELGRRLILHLGSFHDVATGASLAIISGSASNWPGRGQFIEHNGKLVFATRGRVCCHDVATLDLRWSLHMPNSAPVPVGPLSLQNGQVVFFGGDALRRVDVESGEVVSSKSFPRLRRVFPPHALEGDLLVPFAGFDSVGLMRVDPTESKPRWKYTKRGRGGPPAEQPLPVVQRTAILAVNDGSTLVGIDVDDGRELWACRVQWLYTPLTVRGSDIIFGTAGHGHHLRCHDARSGETKWAVPVEGGCVSFAPIGDDFLTGDESGTLRRIRASDGVVVDALALGAPIRTAPLVRGGGAYALRWPREGRAALVRVALA